MKGTLVRAILNYLDCPPHAPTLRYLNRFIHAYIRKVPWESVSRIIKRGATSKTEDCPRLPEEFWSDALKHGFGGTCYEVRCSRQPARLSRYPAKPLSGNRSLNKSVVVNKVIKNRTTRFFSDNKQYKLEYFNRQGKRETPLQTKTLPRSLANVFHMSESGIAEALSIVQELNP